MPAYDISALKEGIAKGERRALARAITIMENDGEGKDQLLDHAFAAAREDVPVIGITGAGGAGKSTLVDKLIQKFRQQGLRVGVIAVDPSSPYTGGAVLGDRVRMLSHNTDEGVFIRSFASRGEPGGISRAAKEALYLYKTAGFSVILVESLGVGQAETDITGYVDVTAVVLAPGNGDDVQLLKAGTQEIADIFVINKADKPEAETLYLQLLSTFGAKENDALPFIAKTIAIKNEGVSELLELFDEVREMKQSARVERRRSRIENEILTEGVCFAREQMRDLTKKLAREVLSGDSTFSEAMERLRKMIHIE